MEVNCGHNIIKKPVTINSNFTPGTSTWWNSAKHYYATLAPLCENMTSTIPKAHNVLLHYRPRRTESWPQVPYTENFMKFGDAFLDICEPTDRHADHNTLHCYWGEVVSI